MQEYTRKINRGFQLTLPQAFRDAYHLHVGDYLRIYEDNGKLIVEPVSIVPKKPIEALKTLFSNASDSLDDLPEKEIMNLVRKEIRRSREETKEQ